jgi:SWI/SNF-related matrix-associated actin-dependent regulator 1 of chromatin subfamily A
MVTEARLIQETPFPYQLTGADFLVDNPQALLADEMGLGKSAQVVLACDQIHARNILIVCPAALRVNWDREFKKFSNTPRNSTILQTGKDGHREGLNIISYDLLVSSQNLLSSLQNQSWDVLVFDEAHYLKERTSKRTKACYGHNKTTGLIRKAKYVWRLTGTPMPNNASELYTHLRSAGVISQSYWDFVFEFCEGFQGDYGYKITGVKNVARLRDLMSEFMLRRKKDDVMKELPNITFTTVTVERSEIDVETSFLEQVRDVGLGQFVKNMEDIDAHLKATLEFMEDSSHSRFADAVAMVEGMSKSTSTLRRYIGLIKLKRCLDIIEEELESGLIDKIVIFAMHQQVIEETRKRFRRFGAVNLFGRTPQRKRDHYIDEFQNNPRCRVFIGQVQAAGVGITLTAAHEIAFIEADWVPANNSQASMRCHRIGQTKPVRVRFFVCANTVDEDVMRVVAHKTREITKIFD